MVLGMKARILAKGEHPYRVIKRRFGFIKVHYQGLKKKTVQRFTLFAPSNLWIGAREANGRRGMSAFTDRAKARH